MIATYISFIRNTHSKFIYAFINSRINAIEPTTPTQLGSNRISIVFLIDNPKLL